MADGGRVTRRQALIGLGAVGASVAVAGCGGRGADDSGVLTVPAERRASIEASGPFGPHQAGVDRPLTPPAHMLLVALRAPDRTLRRSALQRTIETLGVEIGRLAASRSVDPRLPDGPGDLTVQVGLGPRLVRVAGTDLPGTASLPRFVGSEGLSSMHRGGDLVLAIAASNPAMPGEVLDALLPTLAGFVPQWSQAAFRPPGEGTVARNPLGYQDGIVQPLGERAAGRDVWIADGPAAGGTIGVVRRFRLDLAGFRGLSESEQDAVIGRTKRSGAPLSGGTIDTDPDLRAKTPTGEYVIPSGSHVRAAHPSFTGIDGLMLRRSYGFRPATLSAAPSAGLLFVSYQHDLDVFVRTQQRMDRTDRLMDYAAATAEATFLVLPGFSPEQPLGGTLLGA